jgi:hypothetical protein
MKPVTPFLDMLLMLLLCVVVMVMVMVRRCCQCWWLQRYGGGVVSVLFQEGPCALIVKEKPAVLVKDPRLYQRTASTSSSPSGHGIVIVVGVAVKAPTSTRATEGSSTLFIMEPLCK